MEIYFTSWRVSSWVVFSTSYGENKLFDQFYHISAFDFISQEFPAYLHGLWKVDLVCKFSAPFWFWSFDLSTVCYQLWKIVHHHSEVYFLKNTVRLFGMIIIQTYRMFQISERCFYTPTHTVDLFDLRCRKFFLRQICHNHFSCICSYQWFLKQIHWKQLQSLRAWFLHKPILSRLWTIRARLVSVCGRSSVTHLTRCASGIIWMLFNILKWERERAVGNGIWTVRV